MKRSGIRPGEKALKRGSTFKKTPRRKGPAAQRITDRRAWRFRAQTGPCAVCGSRVNVTGHHVIPLRHLKEHGVDPAHWYALENQLRLCMDPSPGRCHERHELHVKRVPRDLVMREASKAFAFAAEHRLAWLFDREYPEHPIERRAA